MYIPNQFAQNDEEQLKNLIENNGFATIISFPANESPYINHLPIIMSPDSNNTLIGHMARRNPQWMHFKNNPNCTMIINGPHTYITPKWYKSGRDVPTWNFAVAHLHGKIELVEKFQGQIDTLKHLVKHFENTSPNPWEFELPDDLLDEASLTSAIISFKFKIEKIEMKFKFSQNRSKEDRMGIIEGLSTRTDDESKAVRNIMLKLEEGR